MLPCFFPPIDNHATTIVTHSVTPCVDMESRNGDLMLLHPDLETFIAVTRTAADMVSSFKVAQGKVICVHSCASER